MRFSSFSRSHFEVASFASPEDLDTILDLVSVALPIHDRGLVLADDHTRTGSHGTRDIGGQVTALVTDDDGTTGEHCEVVQELRLLIPEARCLDDAGLEDLACDVDDECGQRLPFHVLRHDQQWLLPLRSRTRAMG